MGKNKEKNSNVIKFEQVIKTSAPVPWKHLLIYWIIADCVAAVMYFSPLYMSETLGIGMQTLGALFLGAQLLAFPMTVIVGRFAIKFGSMKIVRICILIWGMSVLGLYWANTVTELIIVMIGFSLVIGSTQSILRAHYANRIQVEKSGEGLGYFAIAQKSASVIAPAMVGTISMFTGSLRPAFLVLIFFIMVAFLFSFKLPENEVN